jgi:hypothetical protein
MFANELGLRLDLGLAFAQEILQFVGSKGFL